MDGGVINYLFFQSFRIAVALSADSAISKCDSDGWEALVIVDKTSRQNQYLPFARTWPADDTMLYQYKDY